MIISTNKDLLMNKWKCLLVDFCKSELNQNFFSGKNDRKLMCVYMCVYVCVYVCMCMYVYVYECAYKCYKLIISF